MPQLTRLTLILVRTRLLVLEHLARCATRPPASPCPTGPWVGTRRSRACSYGSRSSACPGASTADGASHGGATPPTKERRTGWKTR